jgi:aminoglycoside/choline kinase family phosphotransferase
MEDVGDLSLEALCKKADEKKKVDYYKKIMDDLVRIHEIKVGKYRVFKLPFDRGKEVVPVKEIYIYDFRMYVQKYLLMDHFGWKNFDRDLINTFFNKVCDELLPHIKSVMYRDFQSSNIFYNSNEERFCYLDFQDARMGVPHYDLASLLRDSYVLLRPEIQKDLLQYYLKKRKLDASDFIKSYEFCVIQRMWHDAGAFARAYKVTGKAHFLKYIKPAIKNALEVMRRYSQFSKITFYFEERLWGRL